MLTVSRLLPFMHAARERFVHDSLFRNATYLMASTAVMSVLGFLFWVFIAHLYSPASIGVASALISVATLISYFSLLGLNSGLIRFLASSKKPSSDINAAAVLVAGVTIVVSTIYAFIGTRIGGDAELLGSLSDKLAFIGLMSTVSLNSLTDAVFIANRRGEYHTIGYATFGLFKLLLPLVLIKFGAMGIFGAYILAMAASLIVSYYLMRRGCGYRLLTKPDWSLLKTIRRYTAHNYVAVVLATLPAQLMPQLIIKQLGPAAVAYFSMAWTMVNLLYIVPSAVTQSLLAESSFDPRLHMTHLKRTLRLLAYILIPAVAVSIVIAPYLLSIFGAPYRQNGTVIFQILAFSTFFFAVSSVGSTVLNIERRTGGIIGAQVVTLLVTAVTTVVFISRGLSGVGLALLCGSFAGSIVHVVLYISHHNKPTYPLEALKPNPGVLEEFLELYGLQGANVGEDLGGGNQSITVPVTGPRGRYILKLVSNQKRALTTVEAINDFMSFLTQFGVPVPEILTTKDELSMPIITDDKISWIGTLMQFEKGSHQKRYSNPLIKNMANVQARLHVAGITYSSQYPKRILPLRTRSLKSHLLVGTPQGLGHFDFDRGNVLTEDERITSVLDFEGLRYDHVVGCVYFTLVDIFSCNSNITELECYIKSYQAVRALNFMERSILRLSLATKFTNPKLLLLSF